MRQREREREKEREKGKILPPEPKGPFPKRGLFLADHVFTIQVMGERESYLDS